MSNTYSEQCQGKDRQTEMWEQYLYILMTTELKLTPLSARYGGA